MSLPPRRRWMHVSNSSALELMKDKFESLLDELFRLLVGACLICASVSPHIRDVAHYNASPSSHSFSALHLKFRDLNRFFGKYY